MNPNSLEKVLKTASKDRLGITVKVIFGVFMLARTIKTVQDIYYERNRHRLKRFNKDYET